MIYLRTYLLNERHLSPPSELNRASCTLWNAEPGGHFTFRNQYRCLVGRQTTNHPTWSPVANKMIAEGRACRVERAVSSSAERWGRQLNSRRRSISLFVPCQEMPTANPLAEGRAFCCYGYRIDYTRSKSGSEREQRFFWLRYALSALRILTFSPFLGQRKSSVLSRSVWLRRPFLILSLRTSDQLTTSLRFVAF